MMISNRFFFFFFLNSVDGSNEFIHTKNNGCIFEFFLLFDDHSRNRIMKLCGFANAVTNSNKNGRNKNDDDNDQDENSGSFTHIAHFTITATAIAATAATATVATVTAVAVTVAIAAPRRVGVVDRRPVATPETGVVGCAVAAVALVAATFA